MIFAAGLGTRLNALTRETPKALVPLNGKALLEHCIIRLKSFGINDIMINVHHFPDKIISFVKSKNSFDINISFSVEDDLLDTGGGLKKARDFFKNEEPFLVQNVDVLTSLDYGEMLKTYNKTRPLALLAVRKRDTARYLLFDEKMDLKGWESVKEKKKIIPRPTVDRLSRFSFMGIQIISPLIFDYFPEKEIFSIIEAYLHILEKGGHISGMDYSGDYWFDLGTPERIKEAEKFIDSESP